jgi:hypothetical protein
MFVVVLAHLQQEKLDNHVFLMRAVKEDCCTVMVSSSLAFSGWKEQSYLSDQVACSGRFLLRNPS